MLLAVKLIGLGFKLRLPLGLDEVLSPLSLGVVGCLKRWWMEGRCGDVSLRGEGADLLKYLVSGPGAA